jgi:hypothetical protein
MELDEWKNASKKRIEKMTFDEAKKFLRIKSDLARRAESGVLVNTLLTPTR